MKKMMTKTLMKTSKRTKMLIWKENKISKTKTKKII